MSHTLGKDEPIYEEVAATDAETPTATVSNFDADATRSFAVVALFEDGTEAELFEVGPDTMYVKKLATPSRGVALRNDAV